MWGSDSNGAKSDAAGINSIIRSHLREFTTPPQFLPSYATGAAPFASSLLQRWNDIFHTGWCVHIALATSESHPRRWRYGPRLSVVPSLPPDRPCSKPRPHWSPDSSRAPDWFALHVVALLYVLHWRRRGSDAGHVKLRPYWFVCRRAAGALRFGDNAGWRWSCCVCRIPVRGKSNAVRR